MAEKKPFVLRLDPDMFDALEQWAADELRSVNGQVEFILQSALRQHDRLARQQCHNCRTKKHS